MIALIAALQQEISPVLKRMRITSKLTSGDSIIYKGYAYSVPVLAIKTGVGRKSAVQAAHVVLHHYPIDVMINIGFCGALNSSLTAGDTVVCRSLQAPSREIRIEPDQQILRTIQESCSITPVSGITIDSFVIGPPEKSSLREQWNADIVDMESYWLAEAARSCNVPFAAVRAVLDQAKDDFSGLAPLLYQKNYGVYSTIATIVQHPTVMKFLPNVYSLMVKARNQVGTCCSAILNPLHSLFEKTNVSPS